MLCLAIFLIVAGLLTAIALIKLNIVIELVVDGKNGHFVISLFALQGIFKLKYEVPTFDINEEGITMGVQKMRGKNDRRKSESKRKLSFSQMIDQLKSYRGLYKNNHNIFCSLRNYIRRKFTIEEIKLDIVIGTGEANHTAILNGALWALCGSLLSMVSHYMAMLRKSISIKSDFSNKKLLIDLYCIINFKIVHIIVMGFKIFVFYLKGKLSIKNNSVGGDLSG